LELYDEARFHDSVGFDRAKWEKMEGLLKQFKRFFERRTPIKVWYDFKDRGGDVSHFSR
jgi:hypothetical protein